MMHFDDDDDAGAAALHYIHPPENSLPNPWFGFFRGVFGGAGVCFKMTL